MVEGRDDSFSFTHALVREVLYEQPSASRRVRLHKRVGEALESLGGTNAELAHHFYEARHVGGAEKALEYALAAAEQAARSVAYEEASAHYRRALELAPEDCDILIALGGTLMRAGDAGGAADVPGRGGARAADAGRLARAALGLGGHYAEAGVVDEQLIALLEQALDALDDGDAALRARLLARLADALMFAGQPERVIELSGAAVEQARGSGDVEALAAALTARHGALLHAEHLAERLELSEHMVALARRAGQRELEGLAQHRHIYDLVEKGELDRARAEHAEFAALADELRQPLLQHFATGWAVVWAQMDGRFEDAQQLAGLCFEYGQRAQSRDAPTQIAGQMLSLQRQREGLGDVIEAIEGALAQYPALVAWHAVLPLAHMDAGQPERARELFETFAASNFEIVPRDMFWLTAITVLAEACALLGDADRARTLYDDARAVRRAQRPGRRRVLLRLDAALHGRGGRRDGRLGGDGARLRARAGAQRGLEQPPRDRAHAARVRASGCASATRPATPSARPRSRPRRWRRRTSSACRSSGAVSPLDSR